ncbi:MAG: DUF3048 domain-containing protein [Oscillospiraceae bacterium]|nr:DUF3048 domain-containing protein [Oscillospiraceae bacterium]
MKKILAALLALAMMGALFTACGGDSSSQEEPVSSQNVSEPEQSSSEEPTFETVKNINPFTGYEKAADYPSGKRAVAVMINNLKDALPQRGTSEADVLYEMVTEGGITRLMAVFSDYTKMPDTGPIRSARDQHIQMMFPYQAMYVHIGASTLAQDMLDRYSYEAQNIDGKYYSAIWWMGAAHDTSSSYCYTNGELLSKFLQGNSSFDDNYETPPIFNFVPYNEAVRVPEGGPANSIHIQFSNAYYADFTYDQDNAKYLKYDTRGQAQIDEGNNRQVAVDNVIVLFTSVTKRPGDTPLFEVDYSNGGYGYYMTQGRYEQIRWLKGLPNQPLRIVDAGGNEIDVEINCGKTYVAVTDLETMFNQFNVDGVNPHNA